MMGFSLWKFVMPFVGMMPWVVRTFLLLGVVWSGAGESALAEAFCFAGRLVLVWFFFVILPDSVLVDWPQGSQGLQQHG